MRRLIPLVGVVLLGSACGSSLPTTVIPLGTPTTDTGLTMTVDNAKLVSPLSDQYFWGRWLVVNMDVVAGDATTWFSGANQQLFIDGHEVPSDPGAAETASAETGSSASLLPHERAAVALAFNVSKTQYTDTSKVELVIRGDVDSPGVVVTLPGTVLD